MRQRLGFLSVVAVLLAAGLGVTAAPVSTDQARRAGESWLAQSAVFRQATARLVPGQGFAVAQVVPVTLEAGGAVVCYHLPLVPHGYLLVSADDRRRPVLAFSPTRSLDLSDQPGNTLRALLRRELRSATGTPQDVGAGGATSSPVARTVAADARWDRTLAATAAVALAPTLDATPNYYTPAGNVLVDPLLTTTWNQNRHYNALCPADPAASSSYAGKAPTGCGPTAVGQVMKYHAWPPYGNGSHTYTDPGPIGGTRSADFADAYDWAAMQDSYDPWNAEPAAAVAAVAELLYEVGVSADIDYEDSGASSSLIDLTQSLNQYFYFEAGSFQHRADGRPAFDAQLRNELLAQRPCVLSIPGHMIVADGLADEAGTYYYHINYGWGGLNSDWYGLTDIAGDAIDDAVFGAQPQFLPLFMPATLPTSTTGQIPLAWTFPPRRLGQVTRFRLEEGQFTAGTFTDNAGDFGSWTSAGWTLATPGYGGSGSCFRCPGQIGAYTLQMLGPLEPGPAASLQFQAKIRLVQDHFAVDVSTDNGLNWETKLDVSNTSSSSAWALRSVDLASYAGARLLIRFRYTFAGGTYWGPSAGVWLDDITVTGSRRVTWTVVDDLIPASAASYQLTGRSNGDYFYTLEAYDGSQWGPRSPPMAVTVLSATAPSGTMAINDGATWTTAAGVTLALTATAGAATVTQMRFHNDAAAWTAWEPYALLRTWTLAPGDGSKTVWAQFQNDGGQLSAPCSAAITLDSIAPVGSVRINDGAISTASTAVTLAFAASDSGSGVADFRCRNAGGTWTAWAPFTDGGAWGLTSGDGSKTVEVQYRDAVGNVSLTCSAVITLASSSGNAPSCVVTGPPSPTHQAVLLFTLTFSEPVSGLTATGITVTGGTRGTLAGNGTVFTLPVTPAASGEVTCQVPTGAAHSAGGTDSLASNLLRVVFDSTVPSVALTSLAPLAAGDPTIVAAAFSEPVADFSLAAVAVVNGFAQNLEGDGDTYTFELVGDDRGAVLATIPAAVVHDPAGNGNVASGWVSAFSLHSGWNLLSFPILPPDCSVTALLAAPGGGTVNAGPVWGWTPSATGLGAYAAATTLEAWTGYWVYCENDAALTVDGQAATGGMALVHGWNLAGPGVEAFVPDTALLNGPVYLYDPAATQYEALDQPELVPGLGHWIKGR